MLPMIDIRNGELADIWPDETSPEFKSISYALHMAIIRMLATCITAINECTVSNHEISNTDATEGMNVAAVAAPVTETYG